MHELFPLSARPARRAFEFIAWLLPRNHPQQLHDSRGTSRFRSKGRPKENSHAHAAPLPAAIPVQFVVDASEGAVSLVKPNLLDKFHSAPSSVFATFGSAASFDAAGSVRCP